MIARRKPIPRTSRPRKRRRGKLASLRREADRLWSLVVRKRGACEVSDSTHAGSLQGAHGFSRRYSGTRWLPINGFCLCAGCHKRFTHDPLGWDNYLRAAWGGGVYRELRRRALAGPPEDMEAVVLGLRTELDA